MQAEQDPGLTLLSKATIQSSCCAHKKPINSNPLPSSDLPFFWLLMTLPQQDATHAAQQQHRVSPTITTLKNCMHARTWGCHAEIDRSKTAARSAKPKLHAQLEAGARCRPTRRAIPQPHSASHANNNLYLCTWAV
jgi:hypothetical protein